MRRWIVIPLLLVVVALGVGLRSVHLDAEGPTTFPNGFYSDAPVKDEAAKGFAPRSRVLFGKWSPSQADDYRFWEILSPVWTWSEFGWFMTVGEGYRSARVFSILWSAGSMVFLYLCFPGDRRRAGLFAALFFAMNFYTLIFGRMGLLETQMNCWLIMAFACQARAGERPWLNLAAVVLWSLAWLTKQSAVAYLPVLAAGLVYQLRAGEGRTRRTLMVIVAAGAVAGAVAWLLLDPDYRVRSVMNLRHGLDYRPDRTYRWMEVKPGRTGSAVLYNLTLGFLQGYLAMFPVEGALALGEVVLLALALKGRRRPDGVTALAVLWWLSARAALTVQGQTFARYYLIQAPSVMILAGLALERLLTLREPRRVLAAALVAACLVFNLAPWASWVERDSRELQRANAWLTQIIGPDAAVVVGEWAAPFCFDTGYRNYYLKSVFNRTRAGILELRPTHLLVVEGKEDGEDMDPAVRRLRKYFPTAYDQRRELSRIRVWPGTRDDAVVILYAIDLDFNLEAP